MSATIAMDPRIRARREEVAAEEGRRRSARALVVGAVLTVVVMAAASTRTPLLDVDEIAVLGANHTVVDNVHAVSGIGEGDPLTDIDLGAARESIAALPWVDTVTSVRRWDGTVEFELSERIPVAQTVSADGAAVTLVDSDGRVLDRLAERRDDLVAIVGAAGSVDPGGWLAASTLDAVAVAAAVPESLSGVVDEVAVTNGGVITLRVSDVGSVVLGTSVDLDLKFIALETMRSQVDLECVQVLDLQVPTVPVLTRASAC